MFHSSKCFVRAAGIASIGLFFIGCGPSTYRTYPVEGRAEFEDGSPVHVGIVECLSVKHQVRSTGTIRRDGSFELTTYKEGDGAVADEHRVVLVQFIMTENVPNHRPSSLGVVHRKYASYATSGLSMKVEAGKENKVRLVVTGPDPVVGTETGHGHDELPAEENQDDKSKK